MTTAHKPTFHPAVGSSHAGGYRHHAGLQQISARDMPSHTKIKYRQSGQMGSESVSDRDQVRAHLEQRERKHQDKILQEKKRAGLASDIGRDDDNDDDVSLSRDRSLSPPPLPANPHQDSDDDDLDRQTQPAKSSSRRAADSDNESEEDDDDDDEEAALMRELERIKQQKEAERKQKELEEAEKAAKERTEAILRGNPLLHLAAANQPNFSVKRRWDDDVIFKNQARDEPQVKKRFINDTIRSDFHKKFLSKYIK
eukprot:TRINITY_DN2310_c0_g4_i2.p1 TRINITY_DN2310_c0_g4~~TRINITY_DN2310_c0_g4_i2.p1  ORF type:complete len:255 (+),score=76.23 TRINITY_DN2310_c0_g4_i2:64-828(+)